jgi:hypothetical protein
MGLVPAICTQCGAKIEVNPDNETGLCTHCNTPFITQKAITNYQINIDNSQQVTKNVTKVVYGREKSEAEDFLDSAETYMKLGEWEKANGQIKSAEALAPGNIEVWWAMFRCSTKNLNDMFLATDSHVSWDALEKLNILAKNVQLADIKTRYGIYPDPSSVEFAEYFARNVVSKYPVCRTDKSEQLNLIKKLQDKFSPLAITRICEILSFNPFEIDRSGVLRGFFPIDENVEIDVVIPEGVTDIAKDVFKGLRIRKIEIPGSVKGIGFEFFGYIGHSGYITEERRRGYAFENLEEVILHDGVQRIGFMAFRDLKIQKVKIPDSVQSIDEIAFGGCRLLKEVTIPASVVEIGKEAFDGTVTKVYCEKEPGKGWHKKWCSRGPYYIKKGTDWEFRKH